MHKKKKSLEKLNTFKKKLETFKKKIEDKIKISIEAKAIVFVKLTGLDII